MRKLPFLLHSKESHSQTSHSESQVSPKRTRQSARQTCLRGPPGVLWSRNTLAALYLVKRQTRTCKHQNSKVWNQMSTDFLHQVFQTPTTRIKNDGGGMGGRVIYNLCDFSEPGLCIIVILWWALQILWSGQDPREERGLTHGQAKLSLNPWLRTYGINQEAAKIVESQRPDFEEREKKVPHRRTVPPNLPPPMSIRMAPVWLFPTAFPICLFKLTISQWMLQHTPHLGFIVSQPLSSFHLHFVWPFMAPLGNPPLCHPQANLSIPSSVPLLHLKHGPSHISL